MDVTSLPNRDYTWREEEEDAPDSAVVVEKDGKYCIVDSSDPPPSTIFLAVSSISEGGTQSPTILLFTRVNHTLKETRLRLRSTSGRGTHLLPIIPISNTFTDGTTAKIGRQRCHCRITRRSQRESHQSRQYQYNMVEHSQCNIISLPSL
jgi:hypothetical protein